MCAQDIPPKKETSVLHLYAQSATEQKITVAKEAWHARTSGAATEAAQEPHQLESQGA